MSAISGHGPGGATRRGLLASRPTGRASIPEPSGHSSGILQADAYTGFGELYERRADGSAQFREAACWAHLRRDFHDVWTSDKSEIAREALDRIGKLYDIERQIAGQPPRFGVPSGRTRASRWSRRSVSGPKSS
jgi:hypothetical protein